MARRETRLNLPWTLERGHETVLTASLGDGWQGQAFYVEQGGELVVRELRIAPAGEKVPGGGVTASTLRRLRLDDLRAALAEHARSIREHMGDAALAPSGLLGRHGLAQLAEEASEPAPRDDLYFARIAARYAELVEQGNKRPAPTIARELDHPKSYVEHAIRRARITGLLTPTTRGRAAGRLTPKARRILARAKQKGD